MKQKLMALGAILFTMALVVTASIPRAESNRRVHQHQTQAAKPACTHGDGVLCTHLPLVSIDTKGQQIEINLVETDGKTHRQSEFIEGQITVYDSAEQNNHLSDAPAVESLAKIKYRGNSSLSFDKKSYKIDLIFADGSENEENEIMGMPSDDQWVLNGPFLDKTLLRNYMCLNIAGEIMPDTSEVRFCELVVNGQYKGVYVAMEAISRSKDRVDLDRYKPEDPYTGYLLRVDRDVGQETRIQNFSKYSLRMASSTAVEILYPSERLLTPEITEYITNDFSAFEKALYSYDYDDPVLGYEGYIDTASFVDYFIINEFFCNYDAGIYSTYFYKDLGDKIHIGPVWDFNNSCDNYMERAIDPGHFEMMNRPRYTMLIKDERFVEKVISRYRQLRKSTLSEAYLMDYIDQSIAFLGGAVDRNYQVWGYSFDPSLLDDRNLLMPLDRNFTSYDASVEQLKTFLRERGDWLDQNIVLLRQFSHESKTKKFNH